MADESSSCTKRWFDAQAAAGAERVGAADVAERRHRHRDAVFFIDPPYTAGGKRAGSRLYTHSEIDHERLFALCESLRGDFLMTYDNADEVRALAERHGFETKAVPMKNTHHAEMAELLIGRNLDWVEDGGIFREAVTSAKAKGKKPTPPQNGSVHGPAKPSHGSLVQAETADAPVAQSRRSSKPVSYKRRAASKR